MSLTVGSLFTGIGGLDLGLEWAGLRIVWQCESNAYCRAVLAQHWPDLPCYPDARSLPYDVPAVDLLCGGFPCQPVSLAGPGLGTDDERWLWPDFARALRLLRPRYALLENVPGLTARGMGDVLGALAALGYGAQWGCVPAAAVGAPHLRWRIFILAYADASGWRGRGRDVGARWWFESAHGGATLAYTDGVGCARRSDVPTPARQAGRNAAERDNPWATESGLGRVANGIPHRVDRLRALGNAVVPQVAELVGRRLLAQIEAA